MKHLDDPGELALALSRVATSKLLRRLVGEINPGTSQRMIEVADERLIPHLMSRLDNESRLKEIAQTGTPVARKTAIALISDREFLRKIEKEPLDEGTRSSLAARLEAITCLL